MGSFTPSSFFEHLSPVPLDAVYSLKEGFSAVNSESKLILGSGVYRDEELQPWVLPSVKKADEIVARSQGSDRFEYLPIRGYSPFYTAARDLLFGSLGLKENRTVSVHTVAGTGANSLGARFLKETISPSAVWVPDPTWVNHHNIWSLAGVEVKTLSRMRLNPERGDVIVLHACAHNPTGVDPTKEQWRMIASLCESKGLFPFFDCAYLGFASDDPDAEAWAIRYFASRDTLEFAIVQSFSKNMGLYGERVGALHFLAATADVALTIKGHLSRLQRGNISQPPTRGAMIATTILKSPDLYREWLLDLKKVSTRIRNMRKLMYDELIRLKTPGSWEHLRTQIGMFSYTGLTADQVATIRTDSHIYLLESGRINVVGLNIKNAAYMARAMDAAVRKSA
ncbi:uncharacterized protein PV06_09760 [Exophiala oligosperma]|uniref:Aspartate aminotransferase n=1 Tax=Exophiala oligosperma TaxID=215243 RepID=A0A0D2D394_9EURO|nr:uncharacterized protein PV06_09760 [Exophiala oligosperma]KIW37768.1 hypothetical protein PV06_09760 [Exophiala oligosperma]